MNSTKRVIYKICFSILWVAIYIRISQWTIDRNRIVEVWRVWLCHFAVPSLAEQELHLRAHLFGKLLEHVG